MPWKTDAMKKPRPWPGGAFSLGNPSTKVEGS